MNTEPHDEANARLRAALRDGDPAAGDRLATEEVRALRRRMLAAQEERAGLLVRVPVSAWAAAAIVAAAGLWLVQVRTEEPAPARIAVQTATPRAAVAPGPPPAGAREPIHAAPAVPALALPERSARTSAPAAAPRPAPPLPPAPAPPILPTQPVLADAVPEPRPLQIQFATPGGTRIIWMLAEESES